MEVSPAQVKAKLDAGEAFTLLDCRNDDERAFCLIEPSLHIPMHQTPERLAEIPRDQPVVVYCHHGVRSLQVTSFLKTQGFDDVQSMAGGIDLWSLRIDPTVPRYG